ncbi:MAG: ROK family protein [Planctomycetota bacterium]|jgi:glucokinase|nr:ROK family protein [Planctomycetota bacterium]
MNDSPRTVVGLDLGGTQVKGGFVLEGEQGTPDVEQTLARTVAMDTDLDAGANDLLDRLAGFARELGSNGPLGLGVPGVFEEPGGRLLRSANLKTLEGLDLGAELADRLDLPREHVCVDNDANVATYGEQWLGAGSGIQDLIMLTLGTGIGSGLVIDGQLYKGPTGKAAEVGHMVVRSLPANGSEDPDLRCGCGAYGCLERLASASAAIRRAGAAGLDTDLRQLCEVARAQPGPERELLFEIGFDLGAGLLATTAVLDVTCYVIGGGFGRSLDLLEPGIHAALAERDYGHIQPRLLPATLGAAAGWIGAARLALGNLD